MAEIEKSLLRFENVTVRFGDVVALNGLSFDVKTGETRIILGAAGSAGDHLIFHPGPRQSVEEAATTATRVDAVEIDPEILAVLAAAVDQAWPRIVVVSASTVVKQTCSTRWMTNCAMRSPRLTR